MPLPRFYPILDTATASRFGVTPADAAARMLRAGARILQFRHKEVFSRDVFQELERVANLCAKSGARLIVNDRADLARLFDAGLHLGQEDLTPSQARIVAGSAAFIGYSTHSALQLQAAAAEPADYFAFGPVFATTTKTNPDPVVGLENLPRLRALTDRPLVAIGGITRSNARGVLDAGADSVAVIGDLFPDIESSVAQFLRM